jgi:DNA-binding NarL/FixJ family response regulator
LPTLFAIHANAGTHLKISRAVAAMGRVELAGRSASAVEALRVFDTLAPDAVTVDVRLPDGDGFELVRLLRAKRPTLAIVMIGPATHRLLKRAVAAGVAAYVPRTAGVLEVAVAIRACLSGRGSFSSRSLNEALRQALPTDLSPRERQVHKLLGAGRTQVEIAAELDVSESTVRTYVARVRAKLGTTDGNTLPRVG